jgi:acyl-CoA dehydrogenase
MMISGSDGNGDLSADRTRGQRRSIPPFTDAHERLRLEIRTFVSERLRPHADRWERDGWFPDEVFGWLARRGYLGLRFAPADGGSDDPVAAAVLVEELARCGSGGVAAGLGAHCGIALPPIAAFGTEAQRELYLRPGLRGELIAALAITEPDAGSDVAALRTRAERVDGGWVVNGAKLYITGGVRADVLVCAVRTGAGSQASRHGGISFLIIERGPGVRARPLRKLGWHSSDTAEIELRDVFVAEEKLLGPEHEGFKLIMANFGWERLLMALGAVGAMQVCFEQTLEAVGPARFGQATRHALAGIATEIEACRAVTYAALRRFVAGDAAVREVAIAKLRTQRAAFDAIDSCLSVLGLDAPESLQRALRDARLGPIGGGTDEIMREILGRTLGL